MSKKKKNTPKKHSNPSSHNSSTTKVSNPTEPVPSSPESEGNLTKLTPSSPESEGNLTKLTPSSPESEGNLTELVPSSPESEGNLTELAPSSPESEGNLTELVPSSPESEGNPSKLAPSSPESEGNPSKLAPSSPESEGNLTKLPPSSPESEGNPTELAPSSPESEGNPTRLAATLTEKTDSSSELVTPFLNRRNKIRKVFQQIEDFADGNFDLCPPEKVKLPRRPSTHTEKTMDERFSLWHSQKVEEVFRRMYDVISTVICLGVIAMLLITVSYLPPFGDPSNPVNNEVSQRYIEEGVAETGATNVIAGMILDYRAFDTFGESAVLFVASISVFLFLQNPPDKEGKKVLNANYKPMAQDPITQMVAKYLIPFLLIFGVYIILNGHISPGGGFAGGSIMGASFILYSAAYGYEVVEKVITEALVKRVTFFSLSFYAVAKGYSFYTGAHHMPTGIPLGNAGSIFSAGLILPLNICVGLIVTCTMYSFYSIFSKGEI